MGCAKWEHRPIHNSSTYCANRRKCLIHSSDQNLSYDYRSRLSALGSRLSALGSRLSALGSRLSALRLGALVLSLPFALDAAAQLGITFTPTDYNGYHISCFGKKDGAIDATVSGGTPPYSYRWSNRAETEDLIDVPSGYYHLVVFDSDSTMAKADITLIEPMGMKVVAEPFKYPSGHNISCHDCFNGSIDVTVYYGVPPYSYTWGDEVYTQDRSGLGALSYAVVVTDANDCEMRSEKLLLTQPERKDWTMEGNANTDASQHFFGTTDAQDVVFKSNGVEVVRLTADGKLKLNGGTEGTGVLMRDGDGTLRGGGELPIAPELPTVPCGDLNVWPFWETDGNDFSQVCFEMPRLGTTSPTPLSIIAGNEQHALIAPNGQTQLFGTTAIAPADVNPFTGIPSRLNVYAADGHWLRLSTGTNKHWRLLPTIETAEESAGLRFHFTNGNFPPTNGLGPLALYEDGGLRAGPSLRVLPNGKVSIGEVSTNTPDYDYQLYVGGGILTERLKVALKTSSEWSDHVFKADYRLMPLKEVADFIAANGHLPNVPSADCMVEEGLDVVKTNAVLLEKIEELTLYIIQTNERLAALERENVALRTRIHP